MLLLMAEPSPLRDRLSAALAQSGHEVKAIGCDDDDAFGAACGKRAVVYLPCSRMLDAPVPDRARATNVVSAAHAPRVEVAVFVVPSAHAYRDELEVVRKDGTPYLVVEAPPLVEELAAALDGTRALLLPAGARLETCEVAALAATVVEAVETEQQGRVMRVPPADLSAVAAFRAAARATGTPVHVWPVWTPLYRLVTSTLRWLRRLLGRPEPAALAMRERLLLAPARS